MASVGIDSTLLSDTNIAGLTVVVVVDDVVDVGLLVVVVVVVVALVVELQQVIPNKLSKLIELGWTS